MKRIKETPNLRHKCYKTKDDKLHATIFTRPFQNVSRKRWEEIFGTEEERQKRLAEWRAKKKKGDTAAVDAPAVHIWDTEKTVLATGMRLSKRELKEYAKRYGKTIEQY